MKFKNYWKEKMLYLIVNILLYLVLAICLYCFYVPIIIILFVPILWGGPLVLWYLIDYKKKADFYDGILETLEKIDHKYLLQSVITEPSFAEGKILYNILKVTDRSMHEEVNQYKAEQIAYREYIEMWVHEIKTPIAGAKLILENHGDGRLVSEELDKVEEFIEQVLYYARSTQANKDYFVKEFMLQTVVNKVIQRYAKVLIHKKVKLNLKNLQSTVYTDPKWVEFMIAQVISNSIKYTNGNQAMITIDAVEMEHCTVLMIEDNGVGIVKEDLQKVFVKGFTGKNGREFSKSTGMGLYLCKKLADKLYLGLEIESERKKGTTVKLIFPKSQNVDN